MYNILNILAHWLFNHRVCRQNNSPTHTKMLYGKRRSLCLLRVAQHRRHSCLLVGLLIFSSVTQSSLARNRLAEACSHTRIEPIQCAAVLYVQKPKSHMAVYIRAWMSRVFPFTSLYFPFGWTGTMSDICLHLSSPFIYMKRCEFAN